MGLQNFAVVFNWMQFVNCLLGRNNIETSKTLSGSLFAIRFSFETHMIYANEA